MLAEILTIHADVASSRPLPTSASSPFARGVLISRNQSSACLSARKFQKRLQQLGAMIHVGVHVTGVIFIYMFKALDANLDLITESFGCIQRNPIIVGCDFR